MRDTSAEEWMSLLNESAPHERRIQGKVELGWERPRAQLSGRTMGDLITVFDAPEGHDPEQYLGRILPVQIEGSAPRLLRGDLILTGMKHSLEYIQGR